jgi:hypothetical protein
MSDIVIPPPPDELSLLQVYKYRAHAAEMGVYAIEEMLRTNVMPYIQGMVKHLHALNEKFPLGDNTVDGAKDLFLKAVRQSMPEYVGLTDNEIMGKFSGVPDGASKSAA